MQQYIVIVELIIRRVKIKEIKKGSEMFLKEVTFDF